MLKSTTRRQLATGALAGGALIAAGVPLRRAGAAEFVFKWGTDVPATHPINVHAQKAADAIREQSNGRLEVKLFPNNQLGSQTDCFAQLRSGALECFSLSGVNVLSSLIPVSAIYGLGFVFKDHATVWKALDGNLGAYLRSQIEAHGIAVMDKIWNNGFRQITTSTRPIANPPDLSGLKIRVPVSALWISLFKSLGAAPTSINFSEVYSALQTRVVDGQENPLVIISTAKLYEVQKYCSMTNHMWDGWWLLVNGRIWQKLPDDLKEIFAKNTNAAGMAEREDVIKLNASLKGELESQGLVFNDVDRAEFKDALRKSGFYAEWKTKFGDKPWALLEEATGPLT